ncbi:hypothetical protein [Citreimonas sp.]|uniref:hypothetical protein n=1 Tax=Citreimonas sp. TaxID=3036715 RepID=UPI004058285C
MAVDRSGTYGTGSTPQGTDFLTQYGSYMDALIDTAVLRLTSIAGTANAITASAEPFTVPATGLVTGMKFTLVPTTNNTGAATLNIDARGAESIVSGDGTVLGADALIGGTRYILEFDGTNFVIIGSSGGDATVGSSRTVYDTTSIWENNLPSNTLLMVELWGAGGGGGSSSSEGGGGGAEYATAMFRASDLAASVTITVPSGAAAETAGGNCTFGSYLSARGGGGANGFQGAAGAGLNGGAGGSSSDGGNAGDIHSGGGGGSDNRAGGDAVYGGGGGSGGGAGTGGSSLYGGDGGTSGLAGQRPGGGGGKSGGTGGGGRCIVTIFGG